MQKVLNSPSIGNITISSKAASGSTTLSRLLADKLGFTLINGGELVREYVKKNNIPLELTTKTPDKYHIDFDNFIKNKLESEKNLIIESWLSGFDAQNIIGVFKILAVCPNDEERIKRLMQRDKMTKKEATSHLITREKENLDKWEKLYKTRDFWNPKLYDLVIDTNKNNIDQMLQKALEAINIQIIQ